MSSEKNLMRDLGLFAISNLVAFFAVRWAIKQLQLTKPPKPCPQFVKDYIAKKGLELDEHELVIASEIADPAHMNVSWEDIGGLEDTIDALKEIVVLPFVRTDIFNGQSKLLQPPRGILLYGRPGCGKTLLAKAIAKESSCFFINLRVSTIVEKWYGESQKLVNAVFSLAYKMQPCIIFIDEIDSFLRERASNDHEATAMMKAQFMSLWDGLSSDSHCQVIIIGATNRPHDVDSAIRRRMPRAFHIGLPEVSQRESILRVLLEDELVEEDLDYILISNLLVDKSGSDIKEICRLATMNTIRELLRSGKDMTRRRKINIGDFHLAIEEFDMCSVKTGK